jgi:glutathione-specific gamma-glutamylcyclotransferase
MNPSTIWIFGYGSLIWRPEPGWLARQEGLITGWRRVFYQGSPDHRGTPDAPGRVVTLLEDPHATTWGAAYLIERDALDALDVREQGGYQRVDLTFYPRGAQPHEATVYIATPQNEHYLGPASPEAIAAHIARSHGPSGPNDEYALRLAHALRVMGADDPHIFAVEAALHALGNRLPP